MCAARRISDLEQMLERISEAAQQRGRVSMDAILDEVGRRSFGPMLLLAGLLAVAPVLGDIPGVPTIVGVFVVLIAGQVVFRRKQIWLPRWLLNRSVRQEKLCKALEWMRKPARFIDRLLRPRLEVLTSAQATYAMAIVCILIGVTMPAMEVVLFAANVAGAALSAFGLSLIARDGLLALLGFIFTAATAGVIAYGLL